jgi:hypothetical protein
MGQERNRERDWVCTLCGERTAGGVPTPLLDGTYGSARCQSPTCNRKKRVFHLEPQERPGGQR